MTEAKFAVRPYRELVNQPAEEGRARAWQSASAPGPIEFEDVRVRYRGLDCTALDGCRFTAPEGTIIWNHGAQRLGQDQYQPAVPDCAQQNGGADQDRRQ